MGFYGAPIFGVGPEGEEEDWRTVEEEGDVREVEVTSEQRPLLTIPTF
jgi:hypothetical protein